MRRKVPCALIVHPEHLAMFRRHGRIIAPMDIDEASIPVAVAQGWIVLGRDSDIRPQINVNVQSNPQREHGYGVTRDDDIGGD